MPSAVAAEEIPDQVRDLRNAGGYRHAVLLKACDLGFRIALAPLNDRSRMSHPLIRWGRDTGNVGDDRQVGGCCTLLFQIPSDLPNQDDRLGLRILLEPPQDVHERLPDDRVASDADHGTLADAGPGESSTTS